MIHCEVVCEEKGKGPVTVWGCDLECVPSPGDEFVWWSESWQEWRSVTVGRVRWAYKDGRLEMVELISQGRDRMAGT